MRRIYFLVPDHDTTKTIVDELLLARIEERHIHVIAKEGAPMDELPEATFLQKSDFVPALERGMTLGGATGIVAGLVAMTFPPAGLVLGGGAVLAIALAGAGVGAWLSSMIGISLPNSCLKKFEDAIEQGEFLMVVDLPKERREEIDELVKQHHPEADIGGTEPHVPPFP
ncbi:MAG: DUF1269 domain-containing protein [Pseudomonadota bacterium]